MNIITIAVWFSIILKKVDSLKQVLARNAKTNEYRIILRIPINGKEVEIINLFCNVFCYT